MATGRNRPSQPTRIMVLAGLMLLQAIAMFFQGASTLSTTPREWGLHEIASLEVIGSLQWVNALVLVMLALLLMSNTIIGRWLATGYGVLLMVVALFIVIRASTVYLSGPPPTGFILSILVFNIIGPGVLIMWMAFPRPEERRLHREARFGSAPVRSQDAT